MKKLYALAFLCTLSEVVSARDFWVCQRPDSALFASDKEIPNNSCRKMEREQIAREFPELTLPLPSGSDAKAGSFCRTQGISDCVLGSDASEIGKLAGVPFRIYPDSAWVAADAGIIEIDYARDEKRWSVGCTRDLMTRLKTCHVHRDDLWIFLPKGQREYVSVGHKHFPGSVTSIRIGSKRFDTADRDGAFSQAGIIPLLKDGNTVVTRYMKWPNRYWEDAEFSLHGASASLKIARWLLKQP